MHIRTHTNKPTQTHTHTHTHTHTYTHTHIHTHTQTQVGEDGLADEIRARVHVDKLAELARDRADEEDSRDVVEER